MSGTRSHRTLIDAVPASGMGLIFGSNEIVTESLLVGYIMDRCEFEDYHGFLMRLDLLEGSK